MLLVENYLIIIDHLLLPFIKNQYLIICIFTSLSRKHDNMIYKLFIFLPHCLTKIIMLT